MYNSRIRFCRFIHCNRLGPNCLTSPLPFRPRKGLFRGRFRRGLIKGCHGANHPQKVFRSLYSARRTRRRREILLFILQKTPIGLEKIANLEITANFNRASQEVPFRQWTLDQVPQDCGLSASRLGPHRLLGGHAAADYQAT